jgi:HEAT repeat protein/lysophospholipase L1-like esterase
VAEPEPKRSRAREIAQNVLLSLVSMAVVLGAAELVLRRLEHGKTAPSVAPYITDWQDWDGEFYTVKSAAAGWPPWEDYNSDGLRDREHEVAKPPGVRRIACLGDSTTLGWGIRPEQAYPQVLEELLESAGEPSEVFNVGLGGWSTRQELIAYRRIARKYRPDTVLLGICLNDVAEMQNNLSRPPRWLAALHRRSAIVRRVVHAEEREIAEVDELFRAPDSPKVRSAFARMFADLRVLRDEVAKDGARFAVLVFPFRFQVEGKAPRPVAQETIAAFCREERMACVDLLPAVRRLGPAAFHDIDHFSVGGARLVAEEVLASGLVTAAQPSPGVVSVTSALVAAGAAHPLPDLVSALRGSDDREKVAAARAVGRLGPKAADAVPALVGLLEDRSPSVRAAAARAIGPIGPRAPAASLALVERLRDDDERVRWRSVESLKELELDPAVCLPSLLAVLGDPRAPGREEAARVIGGLGPAATPAVPALMAALADPAASVRGRAAWALGQIGPSAKDAVPALVRAFADPEIRWWAVDALQGLGPAAAPAVPALVQTLRDPSGNVRWRSTLALGAIGPAAKEAVPALVEAARDDREYVRLAALTALAAVGTDPRVAEPAYRHALRDPIARVRTQAAVSLGELGPAAADAAADLTTRLSDDDPGVRARAARALGRLGPLSPAVRRALETALQDDDDAVRAEAGRALKGAKL